MGDRDGPRLYPTSSDEQPCEKPKAEDPAKPGVEASLNYARFKTNTGSVIVSCILFFIMGMLRFILVKMLFCAKC